MAEKFKHKNGTGSLFVNEYRKADNHPHYTGVIVTPDGKEYRISSWESQNSKGVYWSLKLSEKKEFTPAKNIDSENIF